MIRCFAVFDSTQHGWQIVNSAQPPSVLALRAMHCTYDVLIAVECWAYVNIIYDGTSYTQFPRYLFLYVYQLFSLRENLVVYVAVVLAVCIVRSAIVTHAKNIDRQKVQSHGTLNGNSIVHQWKWLIFENSLLSIAIGWKNCIMKYITNSHAHEGRNRCWFRQVFEIEHL